MAYDPNYAGTNSISAALATKQPTLPTDGNGKYSINISGTCALADQAYAFTEGVGTGSRPIYIDSNGFPKAVGMSTAHPSYLNLNVVSSYAAAHATDADTVDGVHMHIGYSAAESTVCFF
jgi:hypothetical protein